MFTIHIPDELAHKLADLARRENRSLDEVVSQILEEKIAEVDALRPGSPEAFIRAALDAAIRLPETDLADRSREILNTCSASRG